MSARELKIQQYKALEVYRGAHKPFTEYSRHMGSVKPWKIEENNFQGKNKYRVIRWSILKGDTGPGIVEVSFTQSVGLHWIY